MRRLTRRSLLAAGAGAALSPLVRPVGALGALLGAAPTQLHERWIGELGQRAVTIELARGADMLGLQWRTPQSAHPQLRMRTRDGAWGPWVAAGAHGHGPDAPARAGEQIGEPIWTGGTSAVQLRSVERLSGVRLHLVDVSGGLGATLAARSFAASAGALPLATPVLAAGSGQPPIIARRAWALGVSHPRVTPGYGAVRLAFVHHTENPNGYSAAEVPAMLRAIYAFHRNVNGWNDIGYNFVIDRFGRIFEARAGGIDEPVVGAHAGGYNLVSSGVAVLGSFMSSPISTPARHALQTLLAWKLSLHGVPSGGRVTVRVNPQGAGYSKYRANARVSLPRIAGHRDGDSTDCPGNVLYGQLGTIRSAVAALAVKPAKLTLMLVPGSEAGLPATLSGVLSSLSGAPIAAAPIQIQARTTSRRGEIVRESTLAQLLTDVQGAFSTPASFPGVPAGTASLRALSAGTGGYGATISEPLHAMLSASVPTPVPSPATPSPPGQ